MPDDPTSRLPLNAGQVGSQRSDKLITASVVVVVLALIGFVIWVMTTHQGWVPL